jgi:hypothetical protein
LRHGALQRLQFLFEQGSLVRRQRDDAIRRMRAQELVAIGDRASRAFDWTSD